MPRLTLHTDVAHDTALCGQEGRTKQQDQAAKARRRGPRLEYGGSSGFGFRIAGLANLAPVGRREAAQDKQQEEAATKIQALS